MTRTCPSCGRPLPITFTRCGFCFADVRHVRATAGVALAPTGRRWPLARRTTIRLSLFAVVLAWAGWWAYGAFIHQPPPLPLPASTTLQQRTGPGFWGPQGDASNTRRTEARPVLTGQAAWTVTLPAEITTPPVADGERLYVGGRDDRLVALDVRDGREVWAYQSPIRLWGAPVAAGDALYLTLRRGDVIALDAATGQERWSTGTGIHFFASPLVADGVVIAQGAEGVVGLDAATGDELWRIAVPGAVGLLSPVVLDGVLAVPVRSEIVLFDRRTGGRLFAFPQSGSTGLAVDKGEVVAVNQSFAAAVHPGSRFPWWEGMRGFWNQLWIWGVAGAPPRPEATWATRVRLSEIPPNIAAARMLSPALDAERLYSADRDGLVRAFTRGTGALAWELRLPELAASPVLTPDGLLLTSMRGLSLHDPVTGDQVASLPLPGADHRWVAVTTHGTYVVDSDGRVRALRS